MPNRVFSQGANAIATSCLSLVAFLSIQTAESQTKVFTLDADFNEGVLFNLNYDAPNSDQLQLNEVTETFPVLYVANGGEDTLSKIDTNTNKEIARYRTWFGPAGKTGYYNAPHSPWAGPAPSRTAVDGDGNVYVANREFRGGFRPSVFKILSTGFIDRNSNGVADTSEDLDNSGVVGDSAGEILPINDDNANNLVEIDEVEDERVAWVTHLPSDAGIRARSLSIDNDGNIWVGMYDRRVYYKLNGATGAIMAGPIAATGTDQFNRNQTNSPYGSLVDSNGMLWGASLGRTLLKLNTTTDTTEKVYSHSGSDYGIALGDGKVYKARAAAPFIVFDKATETFTSPNPSGFGRTSLGIATDGAGDIFTGATRTISSRGVSKFRPDSSFIWDAAPVNNSETRGTIVDSNQNVWTINRPNNSVSKYRGSDGQHLGNVPVGASPYTYSDASGAGFLQSNPQGTWQVVFNTNAPGQSECVLNYNGQVPGGASIVVETAVSDALMTVGEFAGADLTEVGDGETIPGSGQYVYIKASLKAGGDNNADKPILEDLTVTCPSPEPICGDLDKDGDVDADDRALFIGAFGKSDGDDGFIAEADYDEDGILSYFDYRSWYICYRQYLASLPL